jgi:hypothetical protein
MFTAAPAALPTTVLAGSTDEVLPREVASSFLNYRLGPVWRDKGTGHADRDAGQELWKAG